MKVTSATFQRILVLASTALLVSAVAPTASAIQTMPVITVNGGGMGGGGISGGGLPFPDYPTLMLVVQGLWAATDVRCLKGSAATAMSTSPPGERSVAAEAAFEAVRAWARKNSRWVKGEGYARGDVMNVTYADGGSEEWIVTNPQFSPYLYGNVNGSLRLGKGSVQSTSVCGR